MGKRNLTFTDERNLIGERNLTDERNLTFTDERSLIGERNLTLTGERPFLRFVTRWNKTPKSFGACGFYFLSPSGTGTIYPSANFKISADIFYKSLSTTVLKRNGR